mgnify:CR=1 FL=1
MNKLIEMYDVIDSGYAENKSILEDIKAKEKTKGHIVIRVKTDTKGLLMYLVLKDKEV